MTQDCEGGLRPSLTFTEWLDTTLRLQREGFGQNPPMKIGKERAEYIRWNALAIVDELSEFLAEVKWKPWAKDEGLIISRYAAISEIVDIMHFVANLLVTLGVSGEELSKMYLDKVAENERRQKGMGYDAQYRGNDDDITGGAA